LSLSTVQTYLKPDEAEAAYTATKVDITPTGHAPYTMRVVRVEFESLWIQHVAEGGPRIKHAAQSPTRTFVKFLTVPRGNIVIDGAALPFQAMLRHSQGHRYYDYTADAVQWASMSLPVEQFASAGIAIGGCDLLPPRDPLVVIPSAVAMTGLRQLHSEASALAQHAPWLLAVPEVAHGLEQSLIEALVGCLNQSEVNEASWGQRCHETIMRRFHAILENNPNRPIYVPEICAAIRVPERTLRYCCQDHLGLSPKRYLQLRRMHQAHRALNAAIAAKTTVTEIATRFGFWHFSRFAGTYQSIFGELPSVTLHRPPR
jgi:AraC-like DNA-binding protein